jgi:GT2 family glycosyltransferase
MKDVGIVIIGRNEGERLRLCLNSVSGLGMTIVYVDSGSTDGSIELAQSKGAEVIELDLARPFTAARARNEGFAALVRANPGVRYVQFVDGDCELADGWIERAAEFLDATPDYAVACGRRRELYPDRTIYNRLVDIEWASPIGEATACGGDAMMRVDAFREVGGFNPSLIAGEEPELCVRIRQAGWKVFRLDAEMTRHDIAMERFGQWWRRTVRAGHAYAEGAALHGKSPERHWVRESQSIILWGLLLPILSLILAWPTHGLSLFLLLVYPLQAIRIMLRSWRGGLTLNDALLYGGACVIGKFANAVGLCRYRLGRRFGRHSTLIEYK